MVAITVFPLLAYSLNNLTILKALKLSNPDVGSSNSIILGSDMISTPIYVLFLSPPDNIFLNADPI
jgi:hypothetical protein